MNIAAILHEQARSRPEASALIDSYAGRERVTSFAELERRVAQAASLLARSGLHPGDRVLVFQPMSLELYVALIAIFRLGLVAMFVDPSAGRAHIEQCCQLHPPRAFIGSAKAHLLRLLAPSLRRIPRMFAIGAPVPGATIWGDAAALPPHEDICAVVAETPALLTFTSGSTGQPKAALRTHGFLLAQYRVLERTFPAAPGDVSLMTLPIFVLADLASGVTSLIPPGDLRRPANINPAPILAQIERWRPMRAGASPAFWERVVAHCQRQPRTLPQLKQLYAGGAPVFPPLLNKLQTLAPEAEVVAVYGSTEAEPIAHVARSRMSAADIQAMLTGKGLFAGHVVPEIELRILRDSWGAPIGPFTQSEFDARCLPNGEPGEIVVSGAHVLPGYVDGRGDAETKLRVDGRVWHRTGDAGYRDADGCLWLLGRCSARLDDDRGTLYPFAVESAASTHPGIRRSALVMHAGRRVLVVELDATCSDSGFAGLRRALAWAALDDICILGRIPVDRRHNAKVDYPALYRALDHL
jgi:acyl-CoA synthetase (AMP-forming)/AMP-acid ligase II